MEAAGKLIVDAAADHLIEREGDHFASHGGARAFGDPQQDAHVHRVRKLGRGAEASFARVEIACERRFDHGDDSDVEHAIAGTGAGRTDDLQMVGQLFGLVEKRSAAILPSVEHGIEHGVETGHAARGLGGPIGAAVKRLLVGSEKHRHRPTAAARQALHGVHVNLIDVGALFAVDLDADEVVVELLGDLRVLEAFMLHDVAPMARRIADGEKYRPIEFLCRREGFRAPGVPIDRIVLMLKEVRTRFLRQAIGHDSNYSNAVYLNC